MKKMYIIIGVLVIVIVGLYIISVVNKKEIVNNMTAYSNARLGIEFAYPVGLKGYVIQEYNSIDEITKNKVDVIVLKRSEDINKNGPIDRESPPIISIQVLKNTTKQQVGAWAEAHKDYSNINLKRGEVNKYVLGGAHAIRYSVDGLSVSDTVVVTHGEHAYVITGNYMDTDVLIQKDFANLLASIKFIPQPGQN